MSLDVYLYAAEPGESGTGIFIRDGGSTREISWAEWNEKFPGREPVIVPAREHEPVYQRNITHNLSRMGSETGLHDAIWCPDEHGLTTARQLIEPLRTGLVLLQSDPERFKQFNPTNGWGDYDGFVTWVEAYLRACEEYPDAKVEVSR